MHHINSIHAKTVQRLEGGRVPALRVGDWSREHRAERVARFDARQSRSALFVLKNRKFRNKFDA